MKITDIIAKYTMGEATLEETNEALKAEKAGFHLNPGKNSLTPDEIMTGTAGLLFTGTGTPDKVEIKDGHLLYAVNTVMPDGKVNMKAEVMVKGKMYEVRGTEIIGL